MAHGTPLAENSWIDSSSIVANSYSQFENAKMDFYLNPAGLGVTKGVKERLTANLHKLFLRNGIEFLAVPAYYDFELYWCEGTKLLSECREGLCKTFGPCSAQMKPRKNTPSLSHYGIRLPQGFLKRLTNRMILSQLLRAGVET
jgi:hypothetical protein